MTMNYAPLATSFCNLLLNNFMKLIPLGERVILKPIKADERTAGGIYLPESSEEKKQGEEGIIPSSGRTPSYIVMGKGNEDSFMSCSHGAGRARATSQSVKVLDLADEIALYDELGIVHDLTDQKDLNWRMLFLLRV